MPRILGLFLLLVTGALTMGCFGSGAQTTHPAEFALASCSLGCSGETCAVNSIATNQQITLTFNDAVDPATVSFTQLSLVDQTSGSSPAVEHIVDGDKVIIRPSLIETPAGVQFGFEEGHVYELELFSLPEFSVIRSTIGRGNTSYLKCSISTAGVIDLVPGRPQVAFTPNVANPPTTSDFSVEVVFTDLMQKAQLVNSETGQSPTISVLVVDDSQNPSVEVEVPGTYSISFDQDALTTTVLFTPLAPFPGGLDGDRQLRLDFATQIADLAGNALLNPGSYLVDLPNASATPGTFQELFQDAAMEDVSGSSVGLWATQPGALSSNLDPLTGRHSGGGSGALGVFAPTEDVQLDTDSTTLQLVDGTYVNIIDGVFPFEEIHIPIGVRVTAVGSNPLRLFSRGEIVIDGTLDVSGQAAPSNLGKYFARTTEVIPGESTGGVFDFEAQGGSAGNGSLSGGSGGAGGFSWYLLDGIWGAFQDPDFLDETKNGFTSGMPDATRYFFGISWPQVHGKNGQGVGGVLPTGRPIGLPGDADGILADWEGGSGMGSWAWPPVSLQFPDDISDVTNQSGTPIRSHRDGLGGFLEHALHRSRGGGGGGFWTAGERGGAFDASSSDPLLNTLLTPEVDVVAGVFEFNDDLLLWDANAAGGGQVQDAAGGGYNLPAGIETLSPELGFLLGGAGGGGAGASMHGSYDDDPATGPLDPDGVLDTIRTCSGAGGGAGGGALQLEAGGRISVSGTINVSGGNGGDSRFMLNSLLFPPTAYDDPFAILYGQPGDAGGGGGSGGSLLMRNSGLLQVTSESIQLSGGRGGVGSAGNHGGDGGAGVARFETASGSESLATLQAMVTPDQSIELSPIGSPGVPNIGSYSGISPGTTGDLSGFSGNASGVRSRWFTPQNSVLLVDYSGYQIDCVWNDGLGGVDQTITYSSSSSTTTPGVTPVWIAMQTGWAAPGVSEPDALSLSPWIVPGSNGVVTGLPELRSTLGRMLRFQIVFDEDLVAALIGNNPNAFFEVRDVRFDWQGE